MAPGTLERALALAPRLVAADGGADAALAAGHLPEFVIGDLDSISPAARARLGAERLHRIAEQETTDFDKALRSITAPFVLAVGFTGARLDHLLGVVNVMARHPDRCCVVLGAGELCFVVPRRLRLHLPVGMRFSLFPMAPVEGRSTGLRWPLDGHRFAPDAMTATSNEVAATEVALTLSAPAMLGIVPEAVLEAVLAGLAEARG